MDKNQPKKPRTKGNALFLEWVSYQTRILGSHKAIARRIGKHENTLSRIINGKQGVSEKTIEAFRAAFNLSEKEYQQGPDSYQQQYIDIPLDPARMTCVYPLRLLSSRNPSDCSRCWSVWSHQHQSDYGSYIHVYVDIEDRGLPSGSEAVIHLNKPPRDGQLVMLFSDNPGVYFTPWSPSQDSEDLIGVVDYVIYDQ